MRYFLLSKQLVAFYAISNGRSTSKVQQHLQAKAIQKGVLYLIRRTGQETVGSLSKD